MVVMLVTGLRLPGYMEQVVSGIAGLVTPLALVMLGADMRFSDTVKYKKELKLEFLFFLLILSIQTRILGSYFLQFL